MPPAPRMAEGQKLRIIPAVIEEHTLEPCLLLCRVGTNEARNLIQFDN